MKTTLTASSYALATTVLLASSFTSTDAFAPQPMVATKSRNDMNLNLLPTDPRDKNTIRNEASEQSNKEPFSFFPFHSTFPGDDLKTIAETPATGGEWIPGADNGHPNWLAPSISSTFTAALIYILYELRDVLWTIPNPTLGFMSLSLVTGALIWDNLILALGSFFFRDIETNETKYKILKFLSWPRFTLHAVGVPLSYITIAEMGKFAGLGIFQNDLVQNGIILGALVLVSVV